MDTLDLDKLIQESEDIIVFFKADWSIPCKAAETIARSIGSEVPTIFVECGGDYSSLHRGIFESIKKFNIRLLPTAIRFKSGKVSKVLTGLFTRADYRKFHE